MQLIKPNPSSRVEEVTTGFLSLTCATVPPRSSDLPLSLQPPFGVPTSHPLKDGLDRLPSESEQAGTEGKISEAPRLSNRATQGPDAGPLIERCVPAWRTARMDYGAVTDDRI